MKLILSLCLCISWDSLSNVCQAQTFFSVYDPLGSPSSGQSIKVDMNSDLVIGGYRGDSAMVMKLDQFGTTIWTSTFRTNSANPARIMNIEIDPDNNIIGIGNSQGNLLDDMFYFKMDPQGNLLWLQQEIDPIQMIGYRIHPVSASSYTIGFSTYDMNSANFADVSMASIDASTGELITLSPRLNFNAAVPYIDENVASVFASDGQIYCSGRIFIDGASLGSMRPYVARFSSNGSYLAGRYLCWSLSESARIYTTDIIENDNGLTQVYFGDNNGVSYNWEIGLIRTDYDGNVLWSKNYNILGSSAEIASKVMKINDRYYLAGYVDSGQRDLFLIALDETGNYLWGKRYDSNQVNQDFVGSYSAMADHDGQKIFLTGRHGNSNNHHCMLMAVDIEGGVPLDCVQATDLTVTQTDNPQAQFSYNHSNIAGSLILEGLNPEFSSADLNPDCPPINVAFNVTYPGCNLIQIEASSNANASYIWEDGSTGNSTTVSEPGLVAVWAQIDCCTYRKLVQVLPNTTDNYLNVSLDTMMVEECSYRMDYDIESNLETILIDFGDGTADSTWSGTHLWQEPGTYEVVITANDSCYALTDTIVIRYNGISPSSIFSASGTSCEGGLVQFTNASSTSTSWWWSFGDGTSSTEFEPTHVFNDPGGYTVSLTVSNDCASSTSYFDWIVSAYPEVQLVASDTICLGENLLIEATIESNEPYEISWNVPTFSNSIIEVSPTTNSIYSITVTSLSGCASSDSTQIVVLVPNTLSALGDTVICAGEQTLITAIAQSTVVWSNSFIGSQQLVSPLSSTMYYAEAPSGCGNELVDSVFVQVVDWPVPDFSFYANDIPLNPGDTLLFDEIPVHITNYTLFYGDSCQWYANGVEVDGSIADILYSGSYTYTLECISRQLCSASLSATILVNDPCTFYIPNAFTLDFDGVNDVFFGTSVGCTVKSMTIFNLWGEKIFESYDSNPIWNGTYGETLVKDGVYQYIIEVIDHTENIRTYKGHVTVLR